MSLLTPLVQLFPGFNTWLVSSPTLLPLTRLAHLPLLGFVPVHSRDRPRKGWWLPPPRDGHAPWMEPLSLALGPAVLLPGLWPDVIGFPVLCVTCWVPLVTQEPLLHRGRVHHNAISGGSASVTLLGARGSLLLGH